MTTFGWKRKAGQNVLKDLSTKFSGESEDVIPSNISWVQSFKRKKACLQENCKLKFEEFKTEGLKLAESHRFQEAVVEWDRALSLVPHDYKLLEMKAQVLLQLNSPFPAIQAAEKAVKFNPRWWVAFQTLGRSQLGIGDLEMAKRSFAKAIHLDPTVKELWEEDLQWALMLIQKKKEKNAQEEKQRLSSVPQIDFDEEGYIVQEEDKSKENVVQCRF